MLTEHKEIAPFLNGWRKTGEGQFKEEFASYLEETRRIPDPYSFTFDRDGDLFSPTANRKIKDVIVRSNHIGRVEAEALEKIENWARYREEGVVAWVSPPHEGVYPDLKVIISEIIRERGVKKLFNRAIIFDYGEEQAKEFAIKLGQFSQNRPLSSSLEDIRITPFILNSTDWIGIFEQVVDDPSLWGMVKSGEYIRAKEKALKEAESVYWECFVSNNRIVPKETKMKVLGMLGSNSTSCPTLMGTAFEVFGNNSLDIKPAVAATYDDLPEWRRNPKDSDYCIHCGACGEVIKQVVRQGESCPAKPKSCGAVRQCA